MLSQRVFQRILPLHDRELCLLVDEERLRQKGVKSLEMSKPSA